MMEYKGLALKQQLKFITRTTTVPCFNEEMNKMLNMSGAIHNWLAEKYPRNRSMTHFKTFSKCDILMNNLCEAFNISILNAGDKPILAMLERIRLYIMLLMATRRITYDKWHRQVGQRIRGILERKKKKQRKESVVHS